MADSLYTIIAVARAADIVAPPASDAATDGGDDDVDVADGAAAADAADGVDAVDGAAAADTADAADGAAAGDAAGWAGHVADATWDREWPADGAAAADWAHPPQEQYPPRKHEWCVWYWRSRGCCHGDNCMRAHSFEEYRGPPSDPWTEVQAYWDAKHAADLQAQLAQADRAAADAAAERDQAVADAAADRAAAAAAADAHNQLMLQLVQAHVRLLDRVQEQAQHIADLMVAAGYRHIEHRHIERPAPRKAPPPNLLPQRQLIPPPPPAPKAPPPILDEAQMEGERTEGQLMETARSDWATELMETTPPPNTPPPTDNLELAQQLQLDGIPEDAEMICS